jgi:hypothetical protein
MKLLCRGRAGRGAERGSALLMAFLMIILLYAIVFQLAYGTNADLRVATNDVTNTQIDLAAESALMEVYDRLLQDAEAAAAGDEGAGAAPGGEGLPPGGEQPGAGEGGAGGEAPPSDSREDAWGKPQRTTIGDIELRILVQDEDSKINVLSMLTEDEDEAEKAFDRIVRVVDMFRDGSTVDVDRAEAYRIVESMRQHLRQRGNSVLPKPRLASDDEDAPDIGLPLTLNEFAALDRLDESLFRDFRDERGYIVHGLGAFLTVWTSVDAGPNAQAGGQGQGGGSGAQNNGGNNNNPNNDPAGGQGNTSNQNGEGEGGGETNWGVAVNVNTAPVAVLKALFDDREVSPRFWDSVVEYRNLEEKDENQDEEAEPQLDEYGEEMIKRQIFDSLEELSEVDGYEDFGERTQNAFSQLLSTQSRVFSIYVTARRKTGMSDEDFGNYLGSPSSSQERRDDPRGTGLVRTIRSVVWRVDSGDGVVIVPIVRWEVLDYTPFEVLDYPDENR